MTYQHFAYLYDQLMAHAPYDEWTKFTQEMIRSHHHSIHRIVDLGCGTGEITIRLANAGYDVTGVDISTDMLTCASEKALQKNISVNWVHQDITKLEGFHEVDLCTSYCDVMNYMTNLEDIESVFWHVYNSLAPNGLFIFDIHHIHYAEHFLMDQTFTDVSDDLAYIWECERGENRGEMYHHLTFFKKNGEMYSRFDEIHRQQTYETEMYEKVLKKCGFSKIEFYRDFITKKIISSDEGERIFVVAKK